MKEKILVIVLLIISTNATGQFIDRITFNYGFTKSDLEPVYEQDDTFPYYHYWGNQKIIGFFGGLDFDYFDSKFLALSTGIAFYQKGTKYMSMNLDYLTFDTKLKVKYNISQFIPYLIIGPRIDYLLKHSNAFNEYERLNSLNKVNYGLRYGLGLQYDFKKILVGIGWQNNANFNSIVVNNGEFFRPKFLLMTKQ